MLRPALLSRTKPKTSILRKIWSVYADTIFLKFNSNEYCILKSDNSWYLIFTVISNKDNHTLPRKCAASATDFSDTNEEYI